MTRHHKPAIEVSPQVLEAAQEHGVARCEAFDGVEYIRFADDYPGVPRGTVLIDGRVIPTYPHIGRIFALEAGIRAHFTGSFRVEEKIDGYNVRIAWIRGQCLPFTRGGFVCPFTIDRLVDFGDFSRFFADYPELILCGEVAGPDSPYMDTNPHLAPVDVRFFAFDIARSEDPYFLPLRERDALFAGYNIPHVPCLGTYTAGQMEELRAEVRRLDALGAEGVVIKPEQEGIRVKYITPSINIADFCEDSSLLCELPPEFFVNRLVRLGIGLQELGLLPCDRALSERLGDALLSGFLRTVADLKEGRTVTKRFQVRVSSHHVADRVLRHLQTSSRKIKVTEVSRYWEANRVVLVMEKTYLDSTSTLKALLDGRVIFD